MELKLYNRDLASTVLVEDLTTKVQNIRLTTRLHGGYGICSFSIQADLSIAWQWLADRMFYRLVVTDVTKTLFEGRLEDITIGAGSLNVTAYGYYNNLKDIPYATAYNAVASVVIKAALTANCSQISADQSNIDATDVTITSAAADSYLDIYPNELVEKLLDFSDTSQNRYYFAIWEDRIPYLKARSVSSIDWNVTLKDLTRFSLTHRGSNLWNAAYAVYLAAGVVTRTADADDATSQARYFERKKVVPNLGTVAAAAAQAQRDSVVAEYKDIYPSMENITLGDLVYDNNGKPYPSSWVRAGQVLRIRDLVPASSNAGSVARDTLRTFYIVETEYNTKTRTNRITVDTEKSDLISQIARRL